MNLQRKQVQSAESSKGGDKNKSTKGIKVSSTHSYRKSECSSFPDHINRKPHTKGLLPQLLLSDVSCPFNKNIPTHTERQEKQSEETKQPSETDLDITEFGIINNVFKIIMINMLMVLMEKVDNV